MNSTEEKATGDGAWTRLERSSKLLPFVAILGAVTYALGIFVCWISDGQFGLGLSSIPKERALVCGIVAMLGSIPTIIALSACHDFEKENWKQNFKVLFGGFFWSAVAAGGVLFLLTVIGGLRNAPFQELALQSPPNVAFLLVTLFVPWIPLVISFIKVSTDGTKGHISAVSVLSILLYVSLFGSNLVKYLPVHLGGYSNENVRVSTSFGQPVEAALVSSDHESVILRTSQGFVRVNRSKIDEIRRLDQPRPEVSPQSGGQ